MSLVSRLAEEALAELQQKNARAARVWRRRRDTPEPSYRMLADELDCSVGTIHTLVYQGDAFVYRHIAIALARRVHALTLQDTVPQGHRSASIMFDPEPAGVNGSEGISLAGTNHGGVNVRVSLGPGSDRASSQAYRHANDRDRANVYNTRIHATYARPQGSWQWRPGQ